MELPGMVSADAVIENRNLRLLIMGDPGTGKTTLACHAPGPVLVLDFDNKADSGVRYLKEYNPDLLRQLKVIKFSQNKTLDRPYDHFLKVLTALEASRSQFKFKTIVVDSLTLYMEAMRDHVIKSNPQIKRKHHNTLSMEDYGLIKGMFISDSNRLLSLPCHIIFVAHLKEKEDKNGMRQSVVQLEGSSCDYVPTIFHEIYRAYNKRAPDGKVQRFLQTVNDGNYVCRSSNPKNPGVIPMDFNAILALNGFQPNVT